MSSLKEEPLTGNLPVSVDPGPSGRQGPAWFSGAGGQRIFFWAIVFLLGLIQAWSHRRLVDHDGVAYLDIAENYARGSWSAAINAYYSPLYSWLMAILQYLFRFPLSWESTVLHLVNFAGYLGAYASLEFFLTQLLRAPQAGSQSDAPSTALPETAWRTLGLGLFLGSALLMANRSGQSSQGEPGSTPDIFVLVFVFLAAGLLLRMQSGEARAGSHAVFGAVLGLGFLAKTAMFPLAFVFLGAAGLFAIRKRAPAFLWAPACFVLIAAPWIAVLHHATGRFTYGDAGKLTYRLLAGPQPSSTEWGGETDPAQNLPHPPRRLSTNPPVFEFATPVAGTFPLWYGNSYWLEGWKIHFSRTGQIRLLRESHRNYWEILGLQKEFVVLLLFLVFLQPSFLEYCKTFLRFWAIWLPAVAVLGLYSVVRVEPRYVAAFLVVLWISLFAAIKLKEDARQLARYAVLATVLVTCAFLFKPTTIDFHSILRHTPSEQFDVAEGLRKLVPEGQSLATIGIPKDSFYWARLARVRVISEIPSANVNQYWFAPPATQEKVRSLFAQAGAVGIVTDAMPVEVTSPEANNSPASNASLRLPGWQRIGGTSYFFFPLRPASSSSSVSSGVTTPPSK